MTPDGALTEALTLLKKTEINPSDYNRILDLVESHPDDDRFPWLLEGAVALANEATLQAIYEQTNRSAEAFS